MSHRYQPRSAPMPRQEETRPPQASSPGSQPPPQQQPPQAPSWGPPRYQPEGRPANGWQPRDQRNGGYWGPYGAWGRPMQGPGPWDRGHHYGWGHHHGHHQMLHPRWMDRMASIRYRGMDYRGAPQRVRYDDRGRMIYRGTNGKWYHVHPGQRGYIPPRAWRPMGPQGGGWGGGW